mmetsp:Transcript_42222/g.49079  ORF Transcript_42222/g.49079 Transcript_42222/m.49079 type:complete len:171 (-) Transcript_42222:2504-3016(-)
MSTLFKLLLLLLLFCKANSVACPAGTSAERASTVMLATNGYTTTTLTGVISDNASNMYLYGLVDNGSANNTLVYKMSLDGFQVWSKVFTSEPSIDMFALDYSQTYIYFVLKDPASLILVRIFTNNGSLDKILKSSTLLYTDYSQHKLFVSPTTQTVFISTKEIGFMTLDF